MSNVEGADDMTALVINAHGYDNNPPIDNQRKARFGIRANSDLREFNF